MSSSSQLRNRFSSHFQMNLVWEGVLVGLLVGGVVCAYRMALTGAEGLMRYFIEQCAGNPLRMAGWGAVLLIILLIVGRLMVWEPYTVGSGIPQVEADVIGRINMPWWRVVAAKFAEGTLCTLAGLSLGREGPSVQLGGMAGKAVSKGLKLGRGEEHLLVTCGAGAGMAAAFHAPLSGVMFAIEEIHKSFAAPLVISVMTACIVADFVSSQILGAHAVLAFQFAESLPHMDYWILILLGIGMGILGAAHNLGMFQTQKLYDRMRKFTPYSRLAVPFGMAFVFAFTAPQLLCGGEAIVDLLSSGTVLPIVFVGFLLVGKYVFTTASFGSGAPGGTLTPLVVMGALAGYLYGSIVIGPLGLDHGYIANFMALGIAGLFASVVRAPVTAIILVFELTGSFNALLSLSIVSIVSFVVANGLRVDAFFEHLLARLLGVGTDDRVMPGSKTGKLLHTHVIELGSPIINKRVKDVEWPEGSLVVMIERFGRQHVSHPKYKFQALDEITVIMDGTHEDEVERGLMALCHGFMPQRR